MSEQVEEFRDPQLKAAMLRLRGAHTASADLRQRVLAAVAREESAPDESVPPPAATDQPSPDEVRVVDVKVPAKSVEDSGRSFKLFTSPLGLSLAASVVILIGGLSLYVHHARAEAHEREEYLEDN